MLKLFSFSCKRSNLFKLYNSCLQGERTFLSQSYNCIENWNHRFETSIIQKINIDQFYNDINKRYNTSKKISAIDIDLLVNATKEDAYLDELQDLIHKFRLTNNTHEILASTSHSLIRLLLEHNKMEDILFILNDRLNYGIFPDDYCTILLMNHFIKEKNFVGAAKVGILQMLQEDWSHPVVTQMSLFSCYHYLLNPIEWSTPVEPDPKDNEEIKVRVNFLRNPFFDDHFDITDGLLLTGKSLAWGGKTLKNTIGNTYQAIGWCYYKKWTELYTFLNSLAMNNEEKIYQQSIAMINEYLNSLKDENNELNSETKNEILSSIKKLENQKQILNEDFNGVIENSLKKVISENESEIINNQKQLYLNWEVKREEELNKQLVNIRKQKRIEEMEEQKNELKAREDVLFFFENKEKWDLILEKKKIVYLKNKKDSKSTKIDEKYIPPEV